MQKSLLSIIQTAAAELNVNTTSVVLSSTDPNINQMFALVVAVCDDLTNEFDWQFLQKRQTFTTTPNVSTYNLESDCVRLINGTWFDQTNRWPLRGPLTPTQWEITTTFQIAVGPFERFRVMNNQINLYPVPTTANYTFVYDYISRNYVIDGNTGVAKDAFTQDSDICAFDNRLVTYGLKLKWLAAKGMDTTGAVVDYTRALELFKGQDSPAQRLTMAPTGYRLINTTNYPDGSWVV